MKKIVLFITLILFIGLFGCSTKKDDVVISFVIYDRDKENVYYDVDDSRVFEKNVTIPYNTTLRARGEIPKPVLSDDWYFVGGFVNGEYVQLEELKDMRFTTDTVVHLAVYPDKVGVVDGNKDGSKYHPDGRDDRYYHVVQFVDYDGTVLLSEVVYDGDKVERPTNLNMYREGYVFSGWDGKISSPITKDTIISAIYDKEGTEYNVLFVVRAGDAGKLSYNNKFVKVNEVLDELPHFILTDEEIAAGWEFNGIYLYGSYITEEELLNMTFTEDIVFEYRCKKE